jgi:hypothetical protein
MTTERLGFSQFDVVLDSAFQDLFGEDAHIQHESSVRSVLAKRIATLAETGETDPDLLKQYALAGFALRSSSAICSAISQAHPVTLARYSRA